MYEPLFMLSTANHWTSKPNIGRVKATKWFIDDLYNCGLVIKERKFHTLVNILVYHSASIQGSLALVKAAWFKRVAVKGLNFETMQTDCELANPRIIKTIRLRRNLAKGWIEKADFKVRENTLMGTIELIV